MKSLGIDIGTTTISLAVVTGSEILETRTLSNDSFIHSGNSWEAVQDVDRIIKILMPELDDLLEKYKEIAGIGITGQMHGIIYVNHAGKAVSPLYTWQDRRAECMGERGKSLLREWKNEYGIELASGYGMATHLYNMQYDLVPEEAASFCTVGDYIGMYLAGRKSPLVHTSNAASLGLFCVERGCFDLEKTEWMKIQTELLPEVTGEIAVLGDYKGIPVSTAIGDNQASFYGTVGEQADTLLLNMGTGGQISVISEAYYEVPGIETRPYVSGKYLLVGASLCGGKAYALLENFFRTYVKAATGQDVPQYDVMERLAAACTEKTEKLQVTTTFNGTRTDPAARGSIGNISEENFIPENLIYGTLEGMALELYEMYRKIYDTTGIGAEKIIASGNGMRKNRILRSICKEMFKKEIELTECREEAACGAAFCCSNHSML